MTEYMLTASQKSLLDMQRFYPDTGIGNICGAVIFEDMPDTKLLERAVNEAVRLRDSMRLRFVSRGGETVQYVAEYEYESYELISFADSGELDCFGSEYARVPFGTDGSPMYRIALFELEGRRGAVLCASHLIADGWSVSILARTVYEAYGLLRAGEPVNIPVYSYTERITDEQSYLSSERYGEDKAYWERTYTEAPPRADIRFMRRPSLSAAAEMYRIPLPAGDTEVINRFCGDNKISPAVFFEAAVIILLSAVNGGGKVTIGIPLLGRGTVREKKTAGLFMSVLPLTADIAAGETALSLCGKIASLHRSIFRHGRYPSKELLRDIRQRTGINGMSGGLYGVTVSFRSGRADIPAEIVRFGSGACDVPLSLDIDGTDGSLGLTAFYRTDCIPREEMPLIAGRLLHIIRRMTDGNHREIENISVMPHSEYRLTVHDFNRTETYYPRDKCVHELFSARAAETPDRIALVFGGEEYTYKRLDGMSDAIARRLREQRIKRGDIIPVIAARSPYMIAAMIGVMKAGGAYMPVSPDYPLERIRLMTAAAGARTALTYGYTGSGCDEIALGCINYFDPEPQDNINSPEDTCYVIFTSGSSGTPKAAAISHRNAVNYCSENEYNVFGGIIGKDGRSIVSVTNFVFDIFFTESIAALINGVKIILADDGELSSQKRFAELMERCPADIIQTTPTRLRSLMTDKSRLGYLSAFRKIILGGEEMTEDICRLLRERTKAEIYNIYGPTETTVWSSFCRVSGGDITVGRPAANTRIYILDSRLRPLPAGAAGELCIAGDGVCKGYLNDPDLTAEKFLPDTLHGIGRMYRTGDLARFLADGRIEFLGRMDGQIKIHGIRTEPAEIESVIRGFGGICLAAAALKQCGGRQVLTGYYTADRDIDEAALREHIRSRLPAHMVPAYLVRLDEMPVTPSGKTDRKRLPPPSADMLPAAREEPADDRERLLIDLLSGLIGNGSIGVNDDFFTIGGDSLTAMEFAAAAESRGIYFGVTDIYSLRTVRALAAMKNAVQPTSGRTETRKAAFGIYPRPRTRGDILIYELFAAFTDCCYDFRVRGLKNLDPREQYIFCPNHESDLDCMWVWTALRGFRDINDLCVLAAGEHMYNTLSGRIFRVEGGIPIDRKGDFVPSVERALEVLAAGDKSILIHPEGTRTRTGELGAFRRGAAELSVSTGIRTVPVYISGAREIYPVSRALPRLYDTRRLRRFPLTVRLGRPISPEGKTAARITAEIRGQIVAMKEARGNGHRR